MNSVLTWSKNVMDNYLESYSLKWLIKIYVLEIPDFEVINLFSLVYFLESLHLILENSGLWVQIGDSLIIPLITLTFIFKIM